MMNEKEYQTITEFRTEVTRLVNLYNKLESIPFHTGLGDLLYPSELNMIEAIQTRKGNTVTELCIYFGITKGAVSQTITKLISKGYVSKTRSLTNKKEVIIELTEKGKKVFDIHEQFHRRMDQEIADCIRQIPSGQLQEFKQLLAMISQQIERYSSIPDKHI